MPSRMQLARWSQVLGGVMVVAAVLWLFVPRWTRDDTTAASPQVEGTCTVEKERVLSEGIKVTKASGSSTKYNSEYYRNVAVTVAFQSGGQTHRYETAGVDLTYTPGQQCRCWYDPQRPSTVSLTSPEMQTLYADLDRTINASAVLTIGVLLIFMGGYVAKTAAGAAITTLVLASVLASIGPISADGVRSGTSPLRYQAQAAPTAAGGPRQPEMRWGDTSRRGRPFAKDPSVIRFQGRYLLYYSIPSFDDGRPGDGWGIGIAESRDLRTWTKVSEFLATEPYEAKGVAAPFAMVFEGKVHLFYQTYGNASKDAICHATSADGLRFARNATNPIFRPAGAWTVGRAIDAEVVRHNGRWFLYAATRDPDMKIQMLTGAVSDGGFDRGEWHMLADRPLLKPELPWEQDCIEAPTVVHRADTMFMFYAGAYNNAPQQVGLARSTDGITWTRVSDEPFLRHGAPGSWNSSESGHPGVFVDDDGTPYLFYQGNNDGGRTWLLSFVRLAWRDGRPVIATDPGLPLGPPTLAETRTIRQIADGLTHTHIVRGQASTEDSWTLRVLLPSREGEGSIDPDAPVGMLGPKTAADAVAAKLVSLGWSPATTRFATPALPADVSAHDMGWAVSIGRGATADALAGDEQKLRQQGFRARRWHTSFDGDATSGPWDIHVLTIDPARWAVTSSLGESIVGRETVKAIATREGATAAVNGGFFAMMPFDPASGRGDGEPGEAAGIAALDGHLVSEATAGRPALLLADGGRRLVIDRFATTIAIEGPDVPRRVIDGLNRVPGVIRNCGGTGGDVPTERAAHDLTCTDPSEIIAFTPNGLSVLPKGAGVEVVIGRDGVVTDVRDRAGVAPPPDNWVLQATGDDATWLRGAARVGRPLRVTTGVHDALGKPVALARGDFLVNGGPMLVERGEIRIDADRDGLVRHEPGVDNFFFGWVRQRNPRTMAGVDAQGRILLVAADGRQAGHSAGLSILEAAQVMRSLGAVTAMNLDGGGSTTMWLEGRIVNRPSDPSGERADGDVVLVKPRSASR